MHARTPLHPLGGKKQRKDRERTIKNDGISKTKRSCTVSAAALQPFLFNNTVDLTGSASSAHTDLAHLRTHILLALAPHLRTQI